MKEGKISWDLLLKIVEQRGAEAEGIIQGPKAGIDVAVFDFHQAKKRAQAFYNSQEEVFIVFKTDPITFPTPNPGKYCVIINSNDIVTSGAIPYAFNAVIVLPPKSSEGLFERIQKEIHDECSEKGITILGGHSEISASVKSPVVSGAMLGFVPRDYFIPRKIQEGDKMVCVGYCAKEGVGILVAEGRDILTEKMGSKKVEKLVKVGEEISIVDIALEINKRIQPGLMHDATEGGIIGAAYETIAVENYGLKLQGENFPFTRETKELFELLNVNPFKVISSGTLLVVTSQEKANELEKISTEKTPIKVVGEIVSKKEGITLDGKVVHPPKTDALIEGLKKIVEERSR